MFAPLLPAVQEETHALDDSSSRMFPDSLARLLPDILADLSMPGGIAPQDTTMDAAPPTPLNISPNTAATNWSSAPVTDWPSTPTSFQKREALATLSKRCPLVNEDVLLVALEELNFDVDSAADLLLGVDMDHAMTAFLVKVF